MTKKAKNGLIVGLLFLLALAIALGWVSSGYRNWDYNSWFNYWGKGKVVKVADKQIESNATVLRSGSSSSNDIIYDSDDATVTAVVKKGDTLSLEVGPEGLFVVGTATEAGSWGSNITVEIGKPPKSGLGASTLIGSFEKTITPSSHAGDELHYLIPYDDFTSYIEGIATETTFFIRVVNPAHGEFTVANGNRTYFLKSQGESTAYLDGTDVFASNGDIPSSDISFDISFNQSVGGYSASTVVNGSGGVTVHLANIPFLERDIENVTLTLRATKFGSGAAGTTGCPYYFGFCHEFKLHIAKLPAPTNLKYKTGVLSWDPVDGAFGYAVFDGDNLLTDSLTEPLFSIDGFDFTEGEHIFRVRALGNLGKAIADGASEVMQLNAFNASRTITQLVALTMSVGGDNVMKLVPYGKKVSECCSEVNIPNKEFAGWYYDEGFSRKVESADVLNGDVTIYARLTDKKIVEQKPSWWAQNKWYVLIPVIAAVGVGIVASVVVGIRKKKSD